MFHRRFRQLLTDLVAGWEKLAFALKRAGNSDIWVKDVKCDKAQKGFKNMKQKIIFILVFSVFYLSHNPFSVFANAQPAISQEEDFVALINRQGAAKAMEYYKGFRKNNPNVILFQRKTINNLGWQKADQGDIDEAVKLFELNLLAYPDHYDPWDSYAEAILLCGGKDYVELAGEGK